MNKRNEIHSSVTTFTMDTNDCVYRACGAFTAATERLHSVSVHDVTRVTQKTVTLKGGHKVTRITLHTANGDIDITAHRSA